MLTFKENILTYLRKEKEYCENDIQSHRELPDREKIGMGLLIRDAIACGWVDDGTYKFSVEENNTKLRPGDRVLIRKDSQAKGFQATIIENGFDSVIVETGTPIDLEDRYRIEVIEIVMLDPVIELLEQTNEGMPGYHFIQQLAQEVSPSTSGIGKIALHKVEDLFPDTLNMEQRAICEMVIQRPSLYCIQGPPGTGKTDVLSTIAHSFSSVGKEVLVISHTHQAVNNALNKIIKRDSSLPVIKIGDELKAQEIDSKVILSQSYKDYLSIRSPKKKRGGGDIVGMTYYGAVYNLGLKDSGFRPSIVLVDESSQMPLTLASVVGTFGAGCVVFIGDDKQMPPIFHEKLQSDPLSTSIFSHICDKYPDFKGKLCVTYRMNQEITELVSKNYYEPFGERLISSDFSKNRKLCLDVHGEDTKINEMLASEQSVWEIAPPMSHIHEDMNEEEAEYISKIVKTAVGAGMSIEDMAVITPYRRQVKTIREYLHKDEYLGERAQLPLIDTVERLQGQDVDLIIISTCATDPTYFNANSEFLTNANRLNVMFSRAKRKVIFLRSSKLWNKMQQL